MDRTLFAAALVVVSLTGWAPTGAASVPAPIVFQKVVLPEDFLAEDLMAGIADLTAQADRLAREVVDILLRDGRDLLAG